MKITAAPFRHFFLPSIKKHAWGLLLAASFLSLPHRAAADPDLTGYTLSFEDNFDTLSIAAPSDNPTTKWTSKPAHGSGFGDASFVNPSAGFPFTVSSGILRIEAHKNASGKWESGLISSVCRTTAHPEGVGFSQAKGYWEARMKFPGKSGVWPGFWLLGMSRLANPRTNAAEIDIVEYYCQPIDQFSEVLHVWTPQGQDIGYQWNHATGSTMTTAFHTYSALVKDDFITYYWDGVQKFQLPTPDEAKQPMWCMAEYALGAGWPIDDSLNPSYTYIDYIRAYKEPAGGPAALPTGTKKIVAKVSGKVLDGNGYSGSNVKQQTYAATDNQKWTVASLGSGQYSFREVSTTAAMQVTGGSSADGALIQTKSWAGNLHQKWTAQTASSGYYRLLNVNSGKGMRVVGSSTADGATIEQYTVGTGTNEEFAFQTP